MGVYQRDRKHSRNQKEVDAALIINQLLKAKNKAKPKYFLDADKNYADQIIFIQLRVKGILHMEKLLESMHSTNVDKIVIYSNMLSLLDRAYMEQDNALIMVQEYFKSRGLDQSQKSKQMVKIAKEFWFIGTLMKDVMDNITKDKKRLQAKYNRTYNKYIETEKYEKDELDKILLNNILTSDRLDSYLAIFNELFCNETAKN